MEEILAVGSMLLLSVCASIDRCPVQLCIAGPRDAMKSWLRLMRMKSLYMSVWNNHTLQIVWLDVLLLYKPKGEVKRKMGTVPVLLTKWIHGKARPTALQFDMFGKEELYKANSLVWIIAKGILIWPNLIWTALVNAQTLTSFKMIKSEEITPCNARQNHASFGSDASFDKKLDYRLRWRIIRAHAQQVTHLIVSADYSHEECQTDCMHYPRT